MKRNLLNLTRNTYDLLIIGGGIYGACIAWEASLRGLSVALVEKGDFASATSANSLKTIHGGLRYLQNADFRRMRESIRERRTLLRIAPHLIHPLPVLIPTYGHGMKGKEALSLALAVNDMISCDRNQLDDPQKHIPNGRVISAQDCQQLLPGIPDEGLTGGALFYDAQVYNSERLPLSFLQSAAQVGADVANYVEGVGFLKEGNRITGIKAKDTLTGNHFDIRAKTVINTSGPWMNQVLGWLQGESPSVKVPLAKAVNLVTRPLFQTYAVGISSTNSYRDPNAILNKGSRFLFIAPWRGKSIIGTSYTVWDEKPDDLQVTTADIQDLLDQINQAYPPANLKPEDVDFVHGGLLPRTGVDSHTGEPLLEKQYHIHDHAREGLPGLLSIIGVKYTTARDVAEKAVDQLFKSWGQKPPKSVSDITPIYGGEIEQFDTFLQTALTNSPNGLTEETMRRLVYNYGSVYPDILESLEGNLHRQQAPVDELAVLKAEVIHAVRAEMAQTLSDVIFRRTELGSAGVPEPHILKHCAETMATELGWSLTRIEQEIQAVKEVNQHRFLTVV